MSTVSLEQMSQRYDFIDDVIGELWRTGPLLREKSRTRNPTSSDFGVLLPEGRQFSVTVRRDLFIPELGFLKKAKLITKPIAEVALFATAIVEDETNESGLAIRTTKLISASDRNPPVFVDDYDDRTFEEQGVYFDQVLTVLDVIKKGCDISS
jgi:hypothetical protein